MFKHCEAIRRTVHVVNLDPAAENFAYPVLAGKEHDMVENVFVSLQNISFEMKRILLVLSED